MGRSKVQKVGSFLSLHCAALARTSYSLKLPLSKHFCVALRRAVVSNIETRRGSMEETKERLRGPSLGSVLWVKNRCRHGGASLVVGSKVVFSWTGGEIFHHSSSDFIDTHDRTVFRSRPSNLSVEIRFRRCTFWIVTCCFVVAPATFSIILCVCV